jgi:hypothetical protein
VVCVKNSLYALEQANKLASTLEKISNDPFLDQRLQNQFPPEYKEEIAQDPLEISDLLLSRAILRFLLHAASRIHGLAP